MHVTVIMPVYNAVSTVEGAVHSIQRQSYADWDLIIIDDGSADGTFDLVNSLAREDPRLTVLGDEANHGIAVSLNMGWRAARGALIARMDADDLSLPARLEKQVEFLQKHPEVDVLGTGAVLVNSRDETLGVQLMRENHREIVAKMYRESPFIHPTVMARRTFYEATKGYDESLRRSEDADLWLRSYRQFCFHNLQEPLIRYRVPEKQSPQEVWERLRTLRAAGKREGLVLKSSWYAIRYLVASIVRHLFPKKK